MQLKFIGERVAEYYWDNDLNCAVTTLKILAEYFDIHINEQVYNAAIGMHGAGGYGAQCGLVEGSLMFIGLFAKSKKTADEKIITLCNNFAKRFENEFFSLQCIILRPQGFKADNPPHLCEQLTCSAIQFAIFFMENEVI